jgi:transposase
MPRSKPLYPREFREEAVRLVRSSGRPIAQIARELGIAHGTLSAWVKQAELDAGLRSDRLVTAEREELRRLRRENRILREEREILKKRLPSSLRRPTCPTEEGVLYLSVVLDVWTRRAVGWGGVRDSAHTWSWCWMPWRSPAERRRPAPGLVHLPVERGEERLAQGDLVSISLAAHGGQDPCRPQAR